MTKNQKLILASIVLALASWVITPLAVLTLPLQYVYTHLHEIGHAVAAICTGGTQITILVHADGSGVTESIGGWAIFVSPAGYVGATLFGALVLYMSRSAAGAQRALFLTATVLAIALIVWIRGTVVGLATAVIATLLLSLAGSKLRGDALAFTGQFLGSYLCLASLQAVFDTFHFGGVALQENDAVILQRLSGIPAPISSVIWAGVSVTAVLWMLRRAWIDGSRPDPR